MAGNIQAQVNPSVSPSLSIRDEALVAFEQNLVAQVEDLKTRKYKNEEMHRRVMEYDDKATIDVADQLEHLKIRLHSMEEDIHDVIVDTDEIKEELKNVESAYSDVLRKYERAKIRLEKSKELELLLLEKEQEQAAKCQLKNSKFEGFKKVAQQNLEEMYQELERKAEFIEKENAALTTQLRRAEMREETLTAHVKRQRMERDELNTLVDDLIGKTASGGC